MQLTSTLFKSGRFLAATANGGVFVTTPSDTVYSSFDGGFSFSATKLNANRCLEQYEDYS